MSEVPPPQYHEEAPRPQHHHLALVPVATETAAPPAASRPQLQRSPSSRRRVKKKQDSSRSLTSTSSAAAPTATTATSVEESLVSIYEYYAALYPNPALLQELRDREELLRALEEATNPPIDATAQSSSSGWFSWLWGGGAAAAASEKKTEGGRRSNKDAFDQVNEPDDRFVFSELSPDESPPPPTNILCGTNGGLDWSVIPQEASAFVRWQWLCQQRLWQQQQTHATPAAVPVSNAWESPSSSCPLLLIVGLGRIVELEKNHNNNNDTSKSARVFRPVETSDRSALEHQAALILGLGHSDSPASSFSLAQVRAALVGPHCLVVSWGLFMKGHVMLYRRLRREGDAQVGWYAVATAAPTQPVVHNLQQQGLLEDDEETDDEAAEEHKSSAGSKQGSGGGAYLEHRRHPRRPVPSPLLVVTDVVPLVVEDSTTATDNGSDSPTDNTPPAVSLAIGRLGGFVELVPVPLALWHGPPLNPQHVRPPPHWQPSREARRRNNYALDYPNIAVVMIQGPAPPARDSGDTPAPDTPPAQFPRSVALTTAHYHGDVMGLTAVRTRVTATTEWDPNRYPDRPPAEFLVVAHGSPVLPHSCPSECVSFWTVSTLFGNHDDGGGDGETEAPLSGQSPPDGIDFTLHAAVLEVLDLGGSGTNDPDSSSSCSIINNKESWTGPPLTVFATETMTKYWRPRRKVELKPTLSQPSTTTITATPQDGETNEDEAEALPPPEVVVEHHKLEPKIDDDDDENEVETTNSMPRLTSLSVSAPLQDLQFSVHSPNTTNGDSDNYFYALALLDGHGGLHCIDCSRLERLASQALEDDEYEAWVTQRALPEKEEEATETDKDARPKGPPPLVTNIATRSQVAAMLQTSFINSSLSASSTATLATRPNPTKTFVVRPVPASLSKILGNQPAWALLTLTHLFLVSTAHLKGFAWETHDDDGEKASSHGAKPPTTILPLSVALRENHNTGGNSDFGWTTLHALLQHGLMRIKNTASQSDGAASSPRHEFHLSIVRKLEPLDIVRSLEKQGKLEQALEAASQLPEHDNLESLDIILQSCRARLWERDRNFEALESSIENSYVIQQAMTCCSFTTVEDCDKALALISSLENVEALRTLLHHGLRRLPRARRRTVLGLGGDSKSKEGVARTKASLQQCLQRVGTYELLCRHLRIEPSLRHIAQSFLPKFNAIELVKSFSSRNDFAAVSLLYYRHWVEITNQFESFLQCLPPTLFVQDHLHLFPVFHVDHDDFAGFAVGLAEEPSKTVHRAMASYPEYVQDKFGVDVFVDARDNKIVLDMIPPRLHQSDFGDFKAKLKDAVTSRIDSIDNFFGSLVECSHVSETILLGLTTPSESLEVGRRFDVLLRTFLGPEEIESISAKLISFHPESLRNTSNGDPQCSFTHLLDLAMAEARDMNDFRQCLKLLHPILSFLATTYATMDEKILEFCAALFESKPKREDEELSLEFTVAFASLSTTEIGIDQRMIRDKEQLLQLVCSTIQRIISYFGSRDLDGEDARRLVDLLWTMYGTLPVELPEKDNDNEDMLKLMDLADSLYFRLVILDIAASWSDSGLWTLVSDTPYFVESFTLTKSVLARLCQLFCSELAVPESLRDNVEKKDERMAQCVLAQLLSDMEAVHTVGSMAQDIFQEIISEHLCVPLIQYFQFDLLKFILSEYPVGFVDKPILSKSVISFAYETVFSLSAPTQDEINEVMICFSKLAPFLPDAQGPASHVHQCVDACHHINTVLSGGKQIYVPLDIKRKSPMQVILSVLAEFPESVLVDCDEWRDPDCAVILNKAARATTQSNAEEQMAPHLPKLPGCAIFHLAEIMGLLKLDDVVCVKCSVALCALSIGYHGAAAAICRGVVLHDLANGEICDTETQCDAIRCVRAVVADEAFLDKEMKHELCQITLGATWLDKKHMNLDDTKALFHFAAAFDGFSSHVQHSTSFGRVCHDTLSSRSTRLDELFLALHDMGNHGEIDDSVLMSLSHHLLVWCHELAITRFETVPADFLASENQIALTLGAGLLRHVDDLDASEEELETLSQRVSDQAPGILRGLTSELPDWNLVQKLEYQGFSRNGAIRAATRAPDISYEDALQWAIAHSRDPRFNQPILRLQHPRAHLSKSFGLIPLIRTLMVLGDTFPDADITHSLSSTLRKAEAILATSKTIRKEDSLDHDPDIDNAPVSSNPLLLPRSGSVVKEVPVGATPSGETPDDNAMLSVSDSAPLAKTIPVEPTPPLSLPDSNETPGEAPRPPTVAPVAADATFDPSPSVPRREGEGTKLVPVPTSSLPVLKNAPPKPDSQETPTMTVSESPVPTSIVPSVDEISGAHGSSLGSLESPEIETIAQPATPPDSRDTETPVLPTGEISGEPASSLAPAEILEAPAISETRVPDAMPPSFPETLVEPKLLPHRSEAATESDTSLLPAVPVVDATPVEPETSTAVVEEAVTTPPPLVLPNGSETSVVSILPPASPTLSSIPVVVEKSLPTPASHHPTDGLADEPLVANQQSKLIETEKNSNPGAFSSQISQDAKAEAQSEQVSPTKITDSKSVSMYPSSLTAKDTTSATPYDPGMKSFSDLFDGLSNLSSTVIESGSPHPNAAPIPGRLQLSEAQADLTSEGREKPESLSEQRIQVRGRVRQSDFVEETKSLPQNSRPTHSRLRPVSSTKKTERGLPRSPRSTGGTVRVGALQTLDKKKIVHRSVLSPSATGLLVTPDRAKVAQSITSQRAFNLSSLSPADRLALRERGRVELKGARVESSPANDERRRLIEEGRRLLDRARAVKNSSPTVPQRPLPSSVSHPVTRAPVPAAKLYNAAVPCASPTGLRPTGIARPAGQEGPLSHPETENTTSQGSFGRFWRGLATAISIPTQVNDADSESATAMSTQQKVEPSPVRQTSEHPQNASARQPHTQSSHTMSPPMSKESEQTGSSTRNASSPTAGKTRGMLNGNQHGELEDEGNGWDFEDEVAKGGLSKVEHGVESKGEWDNDGAATEDVDPLTQDEDDDDGWDWDDTNNEETSDSVEPPEPIQLRTTDGFQSEAFDQRKALLTLSQERPRQSDECHGAVPERGSVVLEKQDIVPEDRHVSNVNGGPLSEQEGNQALKGDIEGWGFDDPTERTESVVSGAKVEQVVAASTTHGVFQKIDSDATEPRTTSHGTRITSSNSSELKGGDHAAPDETTPRDSAMETRVDVPQGNGGSNDTKDTIAVEAPVLSCPPDSRSGEADGWDWDDSKPFDNVSQTGPSQSSGGWDWDDSKPLTTFVQKRPNPSSVGLGFKREEDEFKKHDSEPRNQKSEQGRSFLPELEVSRGKDSDISDSSHAKLVNSTAQERRTSSGRQEVGLQVSDSRPTNLASQKEAEVLSSDMVVGEENSDGWDWEDSNAASAVNRLARASDAAAPKVARSRGYDDMKPAISEHPVPAAGELVSSKDAGGRSADILRARRVAPADEVVLHKIDEVGFIGQSLSGVTVKSPALSVDPIMLQMEDQHGTDGWNFDESAAFDAAVQAPAQSDLAVAQRKDSGSDFEGKKILDETGEDHGSSWPALGSQTEFHGDSDGTKQVGKSSSDAPLSFSKDNTGRIFDTGETDVTTDDAHAPRVGHNENLDDLKPDETAEPKLLSGMDTSEDDWDWDNANTNGGASQEVPDPSCDVVGSEGDKNGWDFNDSPSIDEAEASTLPCDALASDAKSYNLDRESAEASDTVTGEAVAPSANLLVSSTEEFDMEGSTDSTGDVELVLTDPTILEDRGGGRDFEDTEKEEGVVTLVREPNSVAKVHESTVMGDPHSMSCDLAQKVECVEREPENFPTQAASSTDDNEWDFDDGEDKQFVSGIDGLSPDKHLEQGFGSITQSTEGEAFSVEPGADPAFQETVVRSGHSALSQVLSEETNVIPSGPVLQLESPVITSVAPPAPHTHQLVRPTAMPSVEPAADQSVSASTSNLQEQPEDQGWDFDEPTVSPPPPLSQIQPISNTVHSTVPGHQGTQPSAGRKADPIANQSMVPFIGDVQEAPENSGLDDTLAVDVPEGMDEREPAVPPPSPPLPSPPPSSQIHPLAISNVVHSTVPAHQVAEPSVVLNVEPIADQSMVPFSGDIQEPSEDPGWGFDGTLAVDNSEEMDEREPAVPPPPPQPPASLQIQQPAISDIVHSTAPKHQVEELPAGLNVEQIADQSMVPFIGDIQEPSEDQEWDFDGALGVDDTGKTNESEPAVPPPPPPPVHSTARVQEDVHPSGGRNVKPFADQSMVPFIGDIQEPSEDQGWDFDDTLAVDDTGKTNESEPAVPPPPPVHSTAPVHQAVQPSGGRNVEPFADQSMVPFIDNFQEPSKDEGWDFDDTLAVDDAGKTNESEAAVPPPPPPPVHSTAPAHQAVQLSGGRNVESIADQSMVPFISDIQEASEDQGWDFDDTIAVDDPEGADEREPAVPAPPPPPPITTVQDTQSMPAQAGLSAPMETDMDRAGEVHAPDFGDGMAQNVMEPSDDTGWGFDDDGGTDEENDDVATPVDPGVEPQKKQGIANLQPEDEIDGMGEEDGWDFDEDLDV